MQEFQKFLEGQKISIHSRGRSDSRCLFRRTGFGIFSGDVIEITRAAVLSDALIAFTSHDTTGSRRGGLSFLPGLCKEKNLEIIARKMDVPSYAKKEGQSLEEAGRILRYQFFYQIQKQRAYHKIATAHHLDDHLETFFSVYYEEALWRDWRDFQKTGR